MSRGSNPRSLRISKAQRADASPRGPGDSGTQQSDIPELGSVFSELPVLWGAPGVESGAGTPSMLAGWERRGLG